MFTFDPNTLYSMADLREKLHGVVELDTLIERLGLKDKRIFRDAVWGWEIMEASRTAKPFSEVSRGTGAAIVPFLPNPRGKGSRRGRVAGPLESLSASDVRR